MVEAAAADVAASEVPEVGLAPAAEAEATFSTDLGALSPLTVSAQLLVDPTELTEEVDPNGGIEDADVEVATGVAVAREVVASLLAEEDDTLVDPAEEVFASGCFAGNVPALDEVLLLVVLEMLAVVAALANGVLPVVEDE